MGRTHDYHLKAIHGGRGRQEGQFMLPNGVAVDGAGHVLVTDAIRCQVLVFDASGKCLNTLGMEGALLESGLKFLNPSAIAADKQGRIYVCDTKNCRIHVLTLDGTPVFQFGRPLVVIGIHEEKGVVGFNYPRGLALDEEEGLVYVADTGNNRLRVFNMEEGKPIQTFGGYGDRPGEFNTPIGLAIGSQGKLLVADSLNYRIQVFERGFRLVEVFGRQGTAPGEFFHPPTGIAVSVNEEIVVCSDALNMHVMSACGEFIGVIGGPRDGQMLPKYYSSAFSGPADLFAVDEYGCQLHHFEYRERKT